jgi:hypothetical protein
MQDLTPCFLDLLPVDPGIDLIKWLMIDKNLRTTYEPISAAVYKLPNGVK